MDSKFTWPKGDTHFDQEKFSPWYRYQHRAREAFLACVRENANVSQEPPMMSVDTIDTIIDIGAHAGTWSITMAREARRVYSYEPVHHAVLKENCEHHGANNVITRNLLLSNNREQKSFYIRQDNSGDSGIGLGGDRKEMVMQSVRLDEQEHEGHIQGIKIDVQGHELEVIQGAGALIRKHQPTLCCELNKGNAMVEILLAEMGYRLHSRHNKDWIFQPRWEEQDA